MPSRLALLLALICLFSGRLQAASAFEFLAKPTSARVVALAGCGLTMIGPESAIYNPAALGLLHLDKKFSVSAPLHGTPFEPITEEAYNSSLSVSGGLTLQRLGLLPEDGPNLGLALAYSRFLENRGTSGQMNEGVANLYSIALAFDYRVRMAIGYTSKSPELDYVQQAAKDEGLEVHDIGLMIDTQLRTNLKRSGSPFSAKDFFVSLIPALAYVHQNATSGSHAISMKRLGFSLSGVLDRNGRSELLSFTAVGERVWQKGRSGFVEAMGVELGLGGLIYLRAGNGMQGSDGANYTEDVFHNYIGYHVEPHMLEAYGFGVDLAGALDWLWELGWLQRPQGPTGELLENLDLSFDYGTMNDSRHKTSDFAQSAVKLSLSF